ncbi:sperm-associated antigen 8, partial [Leptodactylus fuscus]
PLVLNMEDPELVQKPRVAPCLMRNWQEERAAAGLDCAPSSSGLSVDGQTHRHGHSGILSTRLLADMAECTTQQDSYRRPTVAHSGRVTGLREENLRRFLYDKFSQELLEEQMSTTEEMKVTESTTKRDYRVEGFIPQSPAPSKKHDYHSEQAVTFWAENTLAITGVSDIRTRDSPFKRSSAFTTPVSHYLDQPVPHSLENYPNM